MEHKEEVLELLRSELKDSGRILSTHNVEFFCPQCKHHKRKLQVSLITGKWHCWVCHIKGRTVNSLLKLIGSEKRISSNTNAHIEETHKDSPQLVLPKEFIPLWNPQSTFAYKRALRYVVEHRRLSYEDIIRYNVGFCETGKYRDCVIVPSYDKDYNLNYFSIRSINSDFKINASLSRNVIPFESTINWELPIILTEGPFNAITIKHNAIPLYGTQLLSKLKDKIRISPLTDVFVALDTEAYSEAIAMHDIIRSIGKRPHLILLNDQDPNEMGYRMFKSCMINNTQHLDEFDLLKEKIKLA